MDKFSTELHSDPNLVYSCYYFREFWVGWGGPSFVLSVYSSFVHWNLDWIFQDEWNITKFNGIFIWEENIKNLNVYLQKNCFSFPPFFSVLMEMLDEMLFSIIPFKIWYLCLSGNSIQLMYWILFFIVWFGFCLRWLFFFFFKCNAKG